MSPGTFRKLHRLHAYLCPQHEAQGLNIVQENSLLVRFRGMGQSQLHECCPPGISFLHGLCIVVCNCRSFSSIMCLIFQACKRKIATHNLKGQVTRNKASLCNSTEGQCRFAARSPPPWHLHEALSDRNMHTHTRVSKTSMYKYIYI